MKKNQTINKASLPLITLAFPIILESFFRILVSSVDTIMLSFWSQTSVAGVGLASQYIFFINVLFNIICIGTSIVLAQYLGGSRSKDAKHVAQASAVMVSAFAIVLSGLVIVGAKPLLSLYDIESDVRKYAQQYLIIFGGFGSIFTAFNLMQVAILRSYGYTKDAMYISFAANIVNVIGNAFALFGFFGLPKLGVVGVAMSSVFSQFVATILLGIRMNKHSEVQFSLKNLTKVPSTIYKKILSIGIPTAGENLAYNTSQILITAMISKLGTFSMNAHIYSQTIIRFVFIFAASIGSAVQIKTGYLVGSKQPDLAYKKLYQYQSIGSLISIVLVVLINLLKTPIISIFTDDPSISSICYSILLVAIFVEAGRSINLITIPALKGSGDVKFPVLIGILCMWGISVPFSYFFGLKLDLGLPGIWFAFGLDEGIRGVLMLIRWKNKKWQTKLIS